MRHNKAALKRTVTAEVVAAGPQVKNERQRADQVVENYRKAFSGFSEDELAILRRRDS